MVATVLLVCLVAPVAVINPAGADQIADKKAQAARIAAAIEANGQRISVLDEQLNQAAYRIDQLTHQIAGTRRQVAAALRRVGTLRRGLGARAAELYRQAGNGADLASGDFSSFQQEGARNVYAQATASRDHQMIDSYRNARDRAAQKQRSLEKSRRAVVAQQQQLDTSRRQLEQANAEQQQLLNRTRGELATLVKQEQERRAAEEARQAAARRAAADAARRNNGGGIGHDAGGSTTLGPNPLGNAAVNLAMQQRARGVWYRYASPSSWSDPSPDNFDCSGLTGWVYYQVSGGSVYLPHFAASQYSMFPHVAISAVQPGDLVFFGSPIHHVGMVIGNGLMVEASHTGTQVRTSSYYRNDLVGASRP